MAYQESLDHRSETQRKPHVSPDGPRGSSHGVAAGAIIAAALAALGIVAFIVYGAPTGAPPAPPAQENSTTIAPPPPPAGTVDQRMTEPDATGTAVTPVDPPAEPVAPPAPATQPPAN